MLTVLDIIRRSASFFEERGVPDPRLDAELLVGHALGMRRLDLYLQFDRPLEESALETIRPLVRRRGAREPLQHILGEVEFDELAIAVDGRALIPRPETEELLHACLARLPAPPASVLDLGSGSGALALALARRFPKAAVHAVEADADALDLARENAGRNALSERVRFHRGDWFEALEGLGPFQMIVANPPYLTDEEMRSAQPEVREHEPAGALSGGADGMDALRPLARGAPAWLAPGGMLALETGITHHPALAEEAAAAGLESPESLDDSNRRPRFFFAWKPRG